MNVLLYLPSLLQGGAIAIDEFYFHRRRGLGRWERLGHPLDTLTVLAAFGFLTFASPSSVNLVIYSVLAIFSSLFVTKDEWIHVEVCAPGEQWLHAVLFLLHPTAFFAAGWLWWQNPTSVFFTIQSLVLLAFAIYQATYWRLRAQNS